MRAAGLKAIHTVKESTAILISSKKPSDPALVQLITNRIQGVISRFSQSVRFLEVLMSISCTKVRVMHVQH